MANHNLGKVEVADTFSARIKGLLGEKESKTLVITPCKQIHMWFMKFPIDTVFYDKDKRIIHIEENIKPWKISKYVKKAEGVIEFPVGTVSKLNLKVGDVLEFAKKGG